MLKEIILELMNKLPTCIITGCAGFIGSHLAEKLLEKGWKVTGIDNFHPFYSQILKHHNLENFNYNPNFDFIEGSILSEKVLKILPKDVDFVFHFAALSGVRYSIKHPNEYFKINLEGTRKLLENLKGFDKFIFASSSSVYGNLNLNEFPVKENHSLNPLSPYGESKKQTEEFCVTYSKKNKLKMVLLRFNTVYGPRQRPDEAINKFIRCAQMGKPISIYGDGTKERDFTFVSDIVNGTILAAEKGMGIYNLGTGRVISVNRMIDVIENIMNLKINRQYVSSQKGDVTKTQADISKAKLELGYVPKVSFEDGISKCVQWCKETEKFQSLI